MTPEPRMSDPRSVVTSEAFELAPELLGLPLAQPRRRLAAVLVDLALIGLLSRAGGLLLGVAALLFVFRVAAGGPVNAALRTAFRVAVGCFGLAILLVTGCALFFTVGPGADGGPMRAIQNELADADAGPGAPAELTLGDVFSGMSEVQALRNAENREGAVSAATGLARRLERVGAPPEDIRDLLEELLRDAPFDGGTSEVVAAAMAAADTAGPLGAAAERAETAADTVDAAAALADEGSAEATPVTALTLAEILSEFADSLRRREGGDPTSAGGARSRALRREIVEELAGDTLGRLADELARESRDRERAERRLESTRQALEDAGEGDGLLSWIGDVIDDLGLAFGWGGLYMTIFLAWWNGQTPGKKLLGIRVVQLDNSPISLWEAFERSGGYAAGFATGLLGFAQVYWDPNRQAIHDKISETVVVLVGGEPHPGHGSDGSEGTRVGSPV